MRSRTWEKNAVKAAGRKRRRRRRPSLSRIAFGTTRLSEKPETIRPHFRHFLLPKECYSFYSNIRWVWSSVFLLFLTLSNVPSCISRQQIVEHPLNVSVRIGDTAVLRCRVENQKGTLQWVKNGFGLGTTRELPLFERYSMVGKLNLGEYHLQIRNVTVDDDDEYECQLSPTDNEPIRISTVARLAVLAEPKLPELVGIHPPITSAAKSNQIVIDAVELSELRLACRVAGGRPAARVRWAVTADVDGRNVVYYLSSGDASSAENGARRKRAEPKAERSRVVEEVTEEPDGLFTITSNLTFSPSKAENGKHLACLATHETYGSGSTASLRAVAVRLDVSYAPKVRVEVDAAESRVLESGRVVLRCHADARPHRDMTVRWSWSSPSSTEPQRDEKRLTLLDQQRAMISDLKLRDNNARVTCTATNAIGTESASIRLDIPYGPRFMSTNQTRLIRRGDTTTFECDAVGNPMPNIRWFHNDDTQPMAAGTNMTIVDASEWDAGSYRCVAMVAGFPPQSLTHRLRLKTVPDVRLRSELVERGSDDAMIVCEIRSHLLPLKVLWTFNGRPIADSDVSGSTISAGNRSGDASTVGRNGRFRLVTVAADSDSGDSDGRWESRLLVRHFTQTDHGLYNCTAHNELGAAHEAHRVWRRTLWERVAELVAGVPFTYRIGALVVALCLFVLLLFICCVRCHHNSHNAVKVPTATSSSGGKVSRCCCCCCCFGRGTSNNSNYSQDGGDVIVKCEALDGAQFYPELYGSPHMDRSDIVYTKDYISVPQNNPDLDYLPPSSSSNYGAMYGGVDATGVPQYEVYSNGYGATNNNYGSSVTTPVSFADCYGHQPPSSVGGIYGHYGGALNDYVVGNPSVTLGGGRMMSGGGPSPLETLTEVITPDTDGGGGAVGSNDALLPPYEPSSMNGGVNRPMSRISTHV